MRLTPQPTANSKVKLNRRQRRDSLLHRILDGNSLIGTAQLAAKHEVGIHLRAVGRAADAALDRAAGLAGDRLHPAHPVVALVAAEVSAHGRLGLWRDAVPADRPAELLVVVYDAAGGDDQICCVAHAEEKGGNREDGLEGHHYDESEKAEEDKWTESEDRQRELGDEIQR